MVKLIIRKNVLEKIRGNNIKTKPAKSIIKVVTRELGGDANPNAKLDSDDVRDIQLAKLQGMKRNACYDAYHDRISWSGFRKIWYGETWNG